MDEKNAIVADARFEPSPPGITSQTAPDLDQTFWYVRAGVVNLEIPQQRT